MNSLFTRDIVAIIPLEQEYQMLAYDIYKVAQLPFSTRDYSDFISAVLGVSIAPYVCDVNAVMSFLQLYYSPSLASAIATEYISNIQDILRHMGIPVIPMYGFTHRYYFREDCTLTVHYERGGLAKASRKSFIKPPPSIDSKDKVITALSKGETVDEYTQYYYGID